MQAARGIIFSQCWLARKLSVAKIVLTSCATYRQANLLCESAASSICFRNPSREPYASAIRQADVPSAPNLRCDFRIKARG